MCELSADVARWASHALCAGAVDALCEVSAIDTLLSNFIRPLQGEAIATVKRDPITSNLILDTEGVHHPQSATHFPFSCVLASADRGF